MKPPATGRGSMGNRAEIIPENNASVVSNSENPVLIPRFVPGKQLKLDEPDLPLFHSVMRRSRKSSRGRLG